MRKVLMGNHAASIAVGLARADVVSAYPITPQTQVIELLDELQTTGKWKGTFIRVESEHSAMAACLGAATTGARTFTASSSQGLAYMHEMLHWVAGGRLPIVMADVNRALGAPWILWTDQTDSLSQRDTGWMQFYCSSNQEILDSILMAYRVAEAVMIPAMVAYDGFTLSHTYEPVDVPDQKLVDKFLPPIKYPYALDVKKATAFSSLALPKPYMRMRARMDADMHRALDVFKEAAKEFESIFGRRYRLIEPDRCDDAETILVTSGAVASTAQAAINELREEGHKAGNLKMRAFRPFPSDELRKTLKPKQKVAVVDRNYSQGHHGIFCEEIKSALYPLKDRPEIYGFIAGLGGGDITVELLKEIWHETHAGRADAINPVWMEDAR
ncbi:MAG: pyruvate ferredoxin oxidoreductase [Elusimicrobiota bacterium]